MNQTKAKTRHAVAQIAEIPVGERKIVRIPGFGGQKIEIGVFNVGGRFFAYCNVCPHAGAPICLGKVCGTTLLSKVGEFILAKAKSCAVRGTAGNSTYSMANIGGREDEIAHL